ncbi:MarR family transcriptional regulator [Metaclostridioides mangenotii]|uniref:MarR family transcriptional regulator n=1 Tax=Metaclostridioides mangenotii TaxID=1540 RepID=UPI0026F02E93|nr:MarR family transcriptional regulator [Clostridioides mangenotii]
MSVDKKIIKVLKEVYEKEDVLSKIRNKGIIEGYTLSEIHTIDEIGRASEPVNVTIISENLNMTKSAVSKIIKKLVNKDTIRVFQIPENKKERYFFLTEVGKDIYLKHEKIHSIWEKTDERFFKEIEDKYKNITLEVLEKFNEYLRTEIEEGNYDN